MKNRENVERFNKALLSGEIENLYYSGMTYKQVAKDYNVSLEWVRKRTRKMYTRAHQRRLYGEVVDELLHLPRIRYLTMKWRR